MNRLYDMEKVTVETYSYKVNGTSGEPGISYSMERVVIVFKDGKFDHAMFPFTSPYTKAQWEVLAAISEKIKKIEGSS